MHASHQPLDDTPGGERPQGEFIWQGFNPPIGFIVGQNLPSTTPDFHTTTFLSTLDKGDIGNYVSSSTLGYSQQYSHHFLQENGSTDYPHSGSSMKALGNSSIHYTAPHEVSTLSYGQNPSSHLPSHGMNTAPRSTQHLTAWTIRRVTRNNPVVTSHPYDLPSRAELQGVSRPSLITSVNPVAVQPILNVEEDIERYISHNIDDGRWFCTHCNKKSDRRRNRIRDHVAACLGYEIYRCTGKCGNAMCQVKCKTRQNLREHQKRQHRECPECGETMRRQNLGRHINNKHQ